MLNLTFFKNVFIVNNVFDNTMISFVRSMVVHLAKVLKKI